MGEDRTWEFRPTTAELGRRMKTEDIYLFNDLEEVVMRWDHATKQWST